MTTARTFFLSAITASATLATSNLAMPNVATGATLTNKNTNLTASTTGWIMIFSQGTASAQTGVGSQIAPNGVGWMDDTTNLVGQQYVAGNWSFSLGFELGVAGTFVCDVHYRAFIYNPVGPVYSQLCEAISLAQTITNASFNVVTATVAASASRAFVFGEKTYLECQLDITTNTSSANMRMQAANSGTLGNVNAQVITPGFQVPPSSLPHFVSDGGYGGVFA